MTTQQTPIRIDIVSDVVWPRCVIGWRQLAGAIAASGLSVELAWHPFELTPDMGPDGENLRDHIAAKYGTDPAESPKAWARLTASGATLGFTFDYLDDMRMVTAFAAHRLLALAGALGAQNPLKTALFTAYLSERKNVIGVETLADGAADAGFERAEAILADGGYADQVRAAERMWIAQGMRGVPAMVFDHRYRVTGAQGVEE